MDSLSPLGIDSWPAIDRTSYMYDDNESPMLASSSSAAVFISGDHRSLASKTSDDSYYSSAPAPIDYSALSVALMTLGLILIVEVCRHKIDRRVHGRPFATVVLETMYSELSTLGIVEGVVYLIKSYASYNKESKAVFAKVHFLLFYAAIINALMSVLLAFFSSRISHKLWVRTEELELNHYLAIRQEFGRVEKLMGEYEGSSADEDQQAEQAMSIRRGWKHLRQTMRYPMLRRKYDKLLVQVRFHELRVHFLKANNLPLKFKVSDYLIKSELQVFKKCVHISTFAWIMVAAAVNVSYFFFGIVAYASGSQRVGTTMTFMFLGACAAFLPVSYAIFNKMKWIFSQIMTAKLIDHNGDERDEEGVESPGTDSLDKTSYSRKSFLGLHVSRRSTSRQGKALKQLDLFWGGDPNLIIGAFQFMQLGYAIAASILLTFWDSINVHFATVRGPTFVSALLLSYFTFLYIMAQMVPRYTLCTSLGDLTNRRRLHETLAKYKLEEARKKRRHLLEEQEMAVAIRRDAKEKTNFVPLTGVKDTEEGSQVTSKPKTISAGSRQETEKMAKLAELVQTDSADLPASSKSLAGIRKERRKRRIKAFSDGVSLMRLAPESTTGTSKAAAIVLAEEKDKTEPPVAESGFLPTDTKTTASREQMRRERLQKSVSADVTLMRLPASSLYAPGFVSEEEKEEERPGRSFLMSPKAEVDKDIHSATRSEEHRIEGEERYESDDDSVDSFDDIPNVAASVLSAKLEHDAKSTKKSIDIKAFLESKRYRLLSGLLGTMLVFFIIGMRVEVFLIESGTIPDTENTWHFGSLSGSFWWEVSWLSIFILVSSCLLFCECGSSDNLHLLVAGGSDVFLSAICLTLLLWAETKRCCQSGPDCCPKFGSRTYGGLGNIEPWTALIALRVFRFQFGRFVRKIVRRTEGSPDDPTKSARVEQLERVHEYIHGASIRPHALQRSMQEKEEEREHNHNTHKARKNFQNETGTIVNLWKTAVGLHPEIVERHGPFSSELLQAMLGIEIVDNFSPATVPAAVPRTTSNQSDGGSASSAPLTLSRRYPGLAPEAQGVILAGKIGLPVKAKVQYAPDTILDSKMNDIIIHGPEKREAEQFELDQVQNSEEHNDADEPSQMFVEPNAQLIRGMRRCERRLPPLLNEWTVVDVVLTKHELVYFDASDDADHLASLQDDKVNAAAMHKKREFVRDAIIATKGGKGLRLRDIAVGRKVVGHLDLSDVSALKVERFLPLSQHGADSAPRGVKEQEGIREEYWKPTRYRNPSPREYRWKHTVEDRLKLSSKQGCLYLRFYADLENWENVKYEDLGEGEIIKDDALLWCQTIARLCGTDQLHQKLPHFGEEERNAELLDYINIICREHNVTDTNAMRDLQRRIKSRVNLAHLGDMIKGNPTPNVRADGNSTPSVSSSMPSVATALDRDGQGKEGGAVELPV